MLCLYSVLCTRISALEGCVPNGYRASLMWIPKKIELIEIGLHAPDLTPNACYACAKFQKEKCLMSHDELIVKTKAYFKSFIKLFHKKRNQILANRWTDYIILEGDGVNEVGGKVLFRS